MTAHQFETEEETGEERRGEEKFTVSRRHRTYFRPSVGRYVAFKVRSRLPTKNNGV